MNEIIKMEELAPEVREAISCHQQICESGKVAASALVDMGRGLKRMRDGKLYAQLGYETFAEYLEKNGDYSFKERQAYTYIKAVESFSDKFLTEHGELGITKLGLLTALSEQDAVEVIESSDLSGLNADEVKALVREKQALGEQLSFWKEEAQNAKDDAAGYEGEMDKLKERATAAEMNVEKLNKQIEKLKKSHQKELGKLSAELEMVKRENDEPKITDEQRKEIAGEEVKQVSAEYEKQIEALKAEYRAKSEAAEEEKKKLESKLNSRSPDEQMAAMKIYFENVQNAVNTFAAKIDLLADEEVKQKMRGGAIKYLSIVIDELKEGEDE
jgi:hypothetical protein